MNQYTIKSSGLPLARLAASAALLLLLTISPGCGLLRTPKRVVSAVVPGGRAAQPDPLDLQIKLQRFTDDFSSRTVEAIDEYARRMGTDAARVEALQWKLAVTASVTSIASGPNPNVNLVDLVSMVTLIRMTLEDYWVKTPGGPAFQPWLAASRNLETNVWKIAAQVLEAPQLNELREAISQYFARHPASRKAFFSRPQDFAAILQNAQEKAPAPNSVLGFLGLDPTAGLDPAVREVTRTRLFAERAMFTLQRMPYLLRWQTELLSLRLAEQPAAKQVLSDAERLTTSAEVFAKTSGQLPQLVNDQREAAIRQLLDGLAAERTNLLASLAAEDQKLRGLLSDLRQTLDAGSGMATSVNTTVNSFDTLMKRFDRGTNLPPAATHPKPFDILDYAKAAAELGAAARDLDALVKSTDQSLPRAGAQAGRLLQRAFWLGAALLFLLLAGSVLATLTYRALARRWFPDSPGPRGGPP